MLKPIERRSGEWFPGRHSDTQVNKGLRGKVEFNMSKNEKHVP